MIGLGTILFVDWALSYASFKSPLAARVIQGSVPLLVRDGAFDDQALRRHRISREELMSQLRQHGHDSLADVARAYLERSGRLSFVFRPA